MDAAERRKLYNQLDPEEALDPGDPRNVDIDDVDEERRPRGANWVDVLAGAVELSDKPVYQFFTGLPGSGKSTELRRLAKRLRDGDANLLPVIVDAEEVLDVHNPIDVADVVVMSIYQAERAVLEAEGRDPGEALRDGFLPRLWHWVRHTEVELKSVKVGATVADLAGLKPEAALELRSQPSFRESLRKRVTAQMVAFLEHAREAVTALEKRAQARGRNGLVLVVDSLEKLRGSSTNWGQVLSSAEQVFAGDAPFLQLGVHSVFTIPPALVLRLRMAVKFMPMLKLLDREGRRSAPGWDAAKKLVHRRAMPAQLQAIFGERWVDRVDDLIGWSGGYPREVVRLLRQCVAERKVISEPMFRRLLGEAADEYRRTVYAETLPVLARVAIHKRLLFSEAERAAVDQALQNNLVLRYRNDEEWFDIHPGLAGFEPVQEHIAQQRAASASKGD